MHRAAIAWSVLLAGASGAAAQGVALFGDARLGLGFNIDNEGDATGEDDWRAISRVRFGALLAGETDGGLGFGAEILADEAQGGDGGTIGQTEGEVFVSGAFGTLTYGDTDGADLAHVGDLPEVGLTGLGDEHETPFISDGGGFGDDELNFADNPFARPTIRYDYELGGFGLSLSSNRDLTDVGVGASWTGEIDAGSLTVGAGYYRYDAFVALPDEAIELPSRVPPGEQWSAAIGGELGDLDGKVIWTSADSEGEAGFSTLGAGFGAEIGPWELDLYYVGIIDAFGSVAETDGEDSLGVGAGYDLGGAAAVRAGVVDTYAGEKVADFGIEMEF